MLITSALADPELLALTVEGLRRPWREITTIALLDPATSERFPHLDAKLRLHAEIVLAADSSAAAFGEIVDALVCV